MEKGKDLAETSEDLRTMVMEQGAVVTDHSGADPSTQLVVRVSGSRRRSWATTIGHIHSVYPVPEGDPGPR